MPRAHTKASNGICLGPTVRFGRAVPKSKLAQFKERYKQFPRIGMKVDVVTDDNGY